MRKNVFVICQFTRKFDRLFHNFVRQYNMFLFIQFFRVKKKAETWHRAWQMVNCTNCVYRWKVTRVPINETILRCWTFFRRKYKFTHTHIVPGVYQKAKRAKQTHQVDSQSFLKAIFAFWHRFVDVPPVCSRQYKQAERRKSLEINSVSRTQNRCRTPLCCLSWRN